MSTAVAVPIQVAPRKSERWRKEYELYLSSLQPPVGIEVTRRRSKLYDSIARRSARVGTARLKAARKVNDDRPVLSSVEMSMILKVLNKHPDGLSSWESRMKMRDTVLGFSKSRQLNRRQKSLIRQVRDMSSRNR